MDRGFWSLRDPAAAPLSCTLLVIMSVLLPGLAKHAEMPPGQAVVSERCSPEALSAKAVSNWYTAAVQAFLEICVESFARRAAKKILVGVHKITALQQIALATVSGRKEHLFQQQRRVRNNECTLSQSAQHSKNKETAVETDGNILKGKPPAAGKSSEQIKSWR